MDRAPQSSTSLQHAGAGSGAATAAAATAATHLALGTAE